MRRGLRVVACVLASMPLSSMAHAQDLTARQIYDRGAAEYDAHEYKKAAVDFARADELSPNEVTLSTALEAAIRGHDAVTGLDLVARVEKRVAIGTPLSSRAREARTTFLHEVGQVLVTCPAPFTFCKATVDAQRAVIGSPMYVNPGNHGVHIDADGASSDQTAHVDAEHTIEVAPPPEAPTAPPSPAAAPIATAPVLGTSARAPAPDQPAPSSHHGEKLSTTWFWMGGAATVVLAGAAIASGINTNHEHDVYTEERTNKARNAGQSAQLRTNVLFGATALAGIGTGVLGLFFVGWHSGPTVTASARF